LDEALAALDVQSRHFEPLPTNDIGGECLHIPSCWTCQVPRLHASSLPSGLLSGFQLRYPISKEARPDPHRRGQTEALSVSCTTFQSCGVASGKRRRISEFRASGLDTKAGPAATEAGLGMASDHTLVCPQDQNEGTSALKLVKFDDRATNPEGRDD
jgi:hypothetical protein